jgi:hypothetical protein
VREDKKPAEENEVPQRGKAKSTSSALL